MKKETIKYFKELVKIIDKYRDDNYTMKHWYNGYGLHHVGCPICKINELIKKIKSCNYACEIQKTNN